MSISPSNEFALVAACCRMWERFFKFAFVRDPLERFISAAWFHHGATGKMQADPLGVVKGMLIDPAMSDHFLVRPQHHFLCDAEGRLMVDKVGRYERLRGDFDEICSRIGATPAPLPVVNATARPLDSSPMDAELAGPIRETFARDFAVFDYASPLG